MDLKKSGSGKGRQMMEFVLAIAVIVLLYFVDKIVGSLGNRKKARRQKGDLPEEPSYTPRRFEIPAPSGACKNGHQFTDAYAGERIHSTPYVPAHLRSCPTRRCRVCGCREAPLPGPEDLPKGEAVPEALREKIYRFAKMRDMSQQELDRLIRDPNEDIDYRKYAAELMTDEALILRLLHRSHMKDPKEDDTAVWTRLVWQLPAAPDGGPFESIAADPSYPTGSRRLAIARILDMDALDRLAADPDLAEACDQQRPEALCREGHDWQVIGTRIEAHDSHRMNSPYWCVDTYRCSRCGKTRQGESYCRTTSPYANDD